MPTIFGVDEELWSRALKDALKKLETRQKEWDSKPRPITSAPAEPLSVRHTLARVDILAWLEGKPVQRINLRIGIEWCGFAVEIHDREIQATRRFLHRAFDPRFILNQGSQRTPNRRSMVS